MEWHRVSVTIQQLVQASMASPHQLEKERLLSVMARQNGVWSPNHPRYRLLDALHGFTKFYEWQRADVDRLRQLYVYVSKAQRKVCNAVPRVLCCFLRSHPLLSYACALHNAL